MAEDFHGHPARSLQNRHLRLDYLVEAGPRLVRLFPAGSDENLFADVYDFTVPTPYGDFYFLGGHRLWHAPEAMPRTYIPDMTGQVVEEIPEGVRLSRPAEAQTGIAKSVEVRLHPDRPAVTLHHDLRNDGLWSVELAAWAITQFQMGGLAILPLPVGPVDAAGLLPNRQLAFWPYTSVHDPRLRLEDEVMLIQAEAKMPPLKVGYRNPHGWLAYWRAGVLFVKCFELQPGGRYPDFGCNAESFCSDRFFELESLGPLTRLEPGQTVRHTETWELYNRWDVPFLPAAVREILASQLS